MLEGHKGAKIDLRFTRTPGGSSCEAEVQPGELSPIYTVLHFLCKVADHSADEVTKMFQKWESETGKQSLQQRNRDATQFSWRPRHKQTKSRKRARRDHDRSQGNAESQAMEDLESFRSSVEDEPALNDAQDKESVIHGGDFLIRANLPALEEYDKSRMNSVGLSPSKDIRTWARNSAGSAVDAF
ncbi:hypothetical protein B0F90DRAFT_1816382 [Multifurca ochricompacta]|uniref:Uncharacterized protein n=1 Tax=Multifurca ochricompacta TaxID=376703 RepID=A0AAD4QN46_9AGAM|nr:hypothetical protein B0F90DRAFT_1816382 [Multifurca ochricompacta]